MALAQQESPAAGPGSTGAAVGVACAPSKDAPDLRAGLRGAALSPARSQRVAVVRTRMEHEFREQRCQHAAAPALRLPGAHQLLTVDAGEC